MEREKPRESEAIVSGGHLHQMLRNIASQPHIQTILPATAQRSSLMMVIRCESRALPYTVNQSLVISKLNRFRR